MKDSDNRNPDLFCMYIYNGVSSLCVVTRLDAFFDLKSLIYIHLFRLPRVCCSGSRRQDHVYPQHQDHEEAMGRRLRASRSSYFVQQSRRFMDGYIYCFYVPIVERLSGFLQNATTANARNSPIKCTVRPPSPLSPFRKGRATRRRALSQSRNTPSRYRHLGR